MITHNGKQVTLAMRNRKAISLIARNGKAMWDIGGGTGIRGAAAAVILAEYGKQVWSDVRDYAKAHPAIVPFINQDPHLAPLVAEADMRDVELTFKQDGNVIWVRVLHHFINNAKNMFNGEADASFNNNADLFSILKYIGHLKRYDKYEFYAEEYMTVGATTCTTHRWSQTSNPYTDTAVTDFVNISNTLYGFARHYPTYGQETLISYLNPSNKTNWFAAIGCWTTWQSGVPPFDDKAKTPNLGTLDLWVRCK